MQVTKKKKKEKEKKRKIIKCDTAIQSLQNNKGVLNGTQWLYSSGIYNLWIRMTQEGPF